MEEKSERILAEESIAEKLDQMIETKKNENSALRKIFESLKKTNEKSVIKK